MRVRVSLQQQAGVPVHHHKLHQLGNLVRVRVRLRVRVRVQG